MSGEGSQETPQRRKPKPGRAKPERLRARAIELRAAGKTEREIAAVLKIHRSTVSRWLRDPGARAEVAEIGADTRAAAVAKLKAAAEGAVDRLLEVLQDGSDADAIAVAKTILGRVGIVEGATLEVSSGPAEDPVERIERLLGAVVR